MICGLSNRAIFGVWARDTPPAVIDRISASLDPHAVRLHVWIVGLVVFAACQGPAPNESETSSQLIALIPSVDMGTVQVGQTSSPRTVVVRPGAGAQYDVLTAITESCPDFSVQTPGVPGAEVIRECDYYEPCPGGQICPQPVKALCTTIYQQEYEFTVTFRPVVAGATSCVVSVYTQAGQTRTFTVSGTGTVPPIDIDVQPGSIGFGDVRRATTSAAANLSVRNLGGSTLGVSSVSISGPFQLGGATSYQVAPGSAVNHTVTCTPPTVGTHSGAVTISSNDPQTPTVQVPLSCRGIDSNLDISPSPAQIPTTRVGEPVTQTVQLRNSGTAAMTVQSVTLTGSDLTLVSAPDPGTPRGPGAVAQAPGRVGAGASGDVEGSLVVTYDGGQTRSSTLSAKALATSMAMTPDGSVDLGPVCAGQTTTQTFSILANDQGPFRVTSISTPDAPFAVASPALPAQIQGAGASTFTFDVTASPTAEGAASAVVNVTTDIPGSEPRALNVSAIGLPAGVAATPVELDSGSSELDQTTLGQMVTVTNCETTPVAWSNPRIEGTDSGEFAIVLSPQSERVPATGSVSWLVVSQPHSAGIKMATFAVDHPGGTVTVMLLGEGLGEGATGTPGGGDVPPSYYACSTGGAAGASPLVLVLALVLRRRRR